MDEMNNQLLLLSEFVKEDGFELNGYLTHLFEQVTTLSNNEDLNTEPTLWLKRVGFFLVFGSFL